MIKIISKEYSKAQVEGACKNYAEYLEEHCSKQEVIRILSNLTKDYFPDELCLAHLEK